MSHLPGCKEALPFPKVILFDWHGTLVDTLDAMFAAMEEMLPQLEDLDLVKEMLPEEKCQSPQDIKLVHYIRIFRKLHPRILAERRVSRTDIFNAIFGDNAKAKRVAHEAYNRCYRSHFGEVHPFQEGIRETLEALKQLGILVGIATNRSREFLDHEIQLVEDGEWIEHIDMTVCADDVEEYKPAPDLIHKALDSIDQVASADIWYVGDSHMDIETARNAGVTAVYYNGSGYWEEDWLEKIFPVSSSLKPDAVINCFDELFTLLESSQVADSVRTKIADHHPPCFPPHPRPEPRIEPDWHPALAQLAPPELILFDWHATLVDTLDAMYHAVDDMLPELRKIGLLDRMVNPENTRSIEDARLVEYVQSYSQLHPKVKTDRKISRTDIFEVLFGDDQEAKQIAHKIFTKHYRNHFGTVLPFEPEVASVLAGLKKLPVATGVITNRDREFFVHELAAVEGTGWQQYFDTNICGDDTALRKPHPDQLQLAIDQLELTAGPNIWYVGDSTTDVIASKRAGITAVFFNGAQWDQAWLEKIFPGNDRLPHRPDVVVNDFSEFWALVLACKNKN